MTLLLIAVQAIPWYLFPKKNQRKSTPEKMPKDTVETVATVIPEVFIPRDSVSVPVDTFRLDIPEIIKVSLALPFNANGDNFDAGVLDFYSGVLMAAKEMGDKGVDIELNCLDISSEDIKNCFDSDIILGPISTSDILGSIDSLPENKWLVSPLEPRASGMCDSLRIIQLPTDQTVQHRDLAKWAYEEMGPSDRLFVLCNPSESSNSYNSIISELDSLGLKYVCRSDLQEYNDQEQADSLRPSEGTYRFIVASENDNFIGEAVRKVSVMSMLRYNVTLYCPSRVRSIETINIEHLHNCSTRISSSYHIDYSNPNVRKFVYAYRSLFKAEPNSFAFDGYDAMMYFTSLCMEYGREWPKKIQEKKGTGLMLDFKFEKSETPGFRNSAVVRSIYEPDYSIRKVQ